MARIVNAKKEVVAVIPLDQVDYYFEEQGIVDRVGYEVVLDDDEKAAQQSMKKLEGVKFEEVMCSATEADQNGLGVMLTRYLACKLSNKPFTPVNFKFANGNSLVLTADNIEAFQATWEPFRAQFFPVPDVA